jgi:ABC-2 type transport system permease protein
MSAVWIIAQREFKRYFSSPVAYAMAAFIYLILGGIFALNIYQRLPTGQLQADGRMLIQPLVLILVFVTPAITMRLLADEQRMGTLELLLTAPVRDWEMVVGKWLGSFGFMLSILAVTWIYPLIIHRLSTPGIDQGVLLSAYLGVVLMISAMLALGLVSSALFSSPVAAFLVALTILVGLWIVGALGSGAGTFSQVAGYLGLMDHYYNNLYRGILEASDILYYLSLTALGLFLATQITESRRWR